MASTSIATTPVKALLAAAGLFGLAACGGEAPTDYETDVVDESGGELIVEDVDPDAVPVDLPETEMTSVPEDEAPAEEAPAE